MATLTIRLSDEMLQRLRLAAATRKKSTNALVGEAIGAYLPRLSGVSLAEALQDFIGAGGPRPTTDSSQMSEALMEILEEKRRDGHF